MRANPYKANATNNPVNTVSINIRISIVSRSQMHKRLRDKLGTTRFRHEGNFLAYIDSSTEKQGRPSLGLESQPAAAAANFEAYLYWGNWNLGELTEVESGKCGNNTQH